MNATRTLALVSILTVSFPVALSAQENNSKNTDAISIEFVNPSEYTDFGSRFQPSKEEQQALAEEFRRELLPIARRYVPEGYKLQLRILDINMAGEFEPHRGGQMADVRIMRSIYMPSMLVEYRVTGPSGEVVSSGRRRANDLDYQNVVSFRKDERLFYETELARDLISDIMRTI